MYIQGVYSWFTFWRTNFGGKFPHQKYDICFYNLVVFIIFIVNP